MNAYSKAFSILSRLAWIDGTLPGFDIDNVAFSPVAAESWRQCCAAVADLPADESGLSLSIVATLQTRFDASVSRIVSADSSGVIWRWLNAPVGPWITQGELLELRGLATLQAELSKNAVSELSTTGVEQPEQVERCKIKLPTDEAICAVWNECLKTAASDLNVTEICRRIAEQYGQNAESLRTQFNRWKRQNKVKL